MLRTLKILQVIDQLGVGGAERVAIDVTNLLFETNVNVSFLALLTKSNQDNNLHKDIPRFYLNRASKLNLKSLFRLRSILKGFDIIHVHMRHNFRYVNLVNKLFCLNVKVILHDHYGSIQINKSVPSFLNTFLKPKYYIGVSKDLTDWAHTALGLKKNIYLLQNTIIKQKHQKYKNPQGLVILGNIKPVKNQLFAIELAHHLKKHLTIIGKIQDQKYYKLLQQKIQELDFESKITFIHDENNPQKKINDFEIGLMTSSSESGPLVLVEYLAQSLPFISYNTGAVSSILAVELPNSFVNSFEMTEWQKRLDTISDLQIDYESLYETYFSPSNYSQQCIVIYKDILKNY